MAQQDIVPGLLDEIEEAFEEKVNSNRTIKQIEEKISKKTAQLKDGHAYAQELGESLSEVLQEKITPETLPDGKLYWNIADRTVCPMLEQNHKLVNDTAVEIQSIQDEKDGIELQPVRGEFPKERIHGLIDKMVEEPDVEKALGFLGEPIVNNTAAFFDQFIEANADFRHKAGLHEVIERVGTPGACPWCAALAGTRDYSTGMDRDVFRRHENCRCLVTFKSGKRRQNVWSKELWEEEDIEIPIIKEESNAKEVIRDLPKGEDVTAEYLRNATPGIGNKVVNDGFKDKNHEKEIGEWIFNTFGGDISFLPEDNPEGEKNPDYLWDGKYWDLKYLSTASRSTIDDRIRHGLKQIEKSPGGIIIDFSNSSLSLKEGISKVADTGEKRLKRDGDFIVKKGSEFRAIRIKK